MKLGRYNIRLSKEKAPNTSGEERGQSGSQADGYFTNEASLRGIKNPSILRIMDMLDQDGTMAGLYAVMTYPVLATPWRVVPHPEDVVKTKDTSGNEIETHPQADFAEGALRKPLHEGGMSTPFSLVISDIALGVAQGYRFFELVYKIDDEGHIVFKKIAAREDKDITILTDDNGGFAGVEQMVYKKSTGKTEKVLIEIPYSFLYTFRKDRNKLKGQSAFRAAFYHYDKKHRLYYLINQQAQVQAIPFKKLEAPEGATDEDRDANLNAVDRMAVRPSIALPFGWKLDIEQPGRGIDLLPYVDHHDASAARSVLAQMILLGNQSTGSGGSFALSDSHSDLFKIGEIALMSGIEEHITAFLISKLYDYNFEKPLYGTFKFDDMSDSVSLMLDTAFNSLVTKGTIPQWILDGIADKMAERLEIEKPEDADSNDGNSDGAGGTTPTDKTVENSKTSKKKESRFANKEEWWRELTPTEEKVQFATIKKKAETDEEKFLSEIKPVFDKMAADAIERLEPQLDDGVKALDGFALNYDDELQKIMAERMTDAYSTAKAAAADELKEKAPANKKESKDLITEHTKAIVERQYSDMLFNLKTIVTDAVRKNLLDKTELSIADVIASIALMFSTFFDEKEPLTASSLITAAINIGRDDVFQLFDDKIYGYQYSAILDEVVCPVCEDLDGSVVDSDTYNDTIWMPPIHFNCRCIWVAIMDDEDDKPDFKDIPDSPGGTDAPTLSYTHSGGLYLSKETEA